MRHLLGWFMHDNQWRSYEISNGVSYINGHEQSFDFYERWRTADKVMSVHLIGITNYDLDELGKEGYAVSHEIKEIFTPYPDNLSEIEAKLYDDKR